MKKTKIIDIEPEGPQTLHAVIDTRGNRWKETKLGVSGGGVNILGLFTKSKQADIAAEAIKDQIRGYSTDDRDLEDEEDEEDDEDEAAPFDGADIRHIRVVQIQSFDKQSSFLLASRKEGISSRRAAAISKLTKAEQRLLGLAEG